ncbi:hypothetical protein PSAB6_270101 [Paraburkholderia sabiae]|nr:hypothetical protein PSAB6_270101 [Paraburkholderia sabiae]
MFMPHMREIHPLLRVTLASGSTQAM